MAIRAEDRNQRCEIGRKTPVLNYERIECKIMDREIMWISLDGQKYEHVRLTSNKDLICANGLLIHLSPENSYRIRYEINCDSEWQVRNVEMNVLDESNRNLVLYSDGNGNWTNKDGQIITDLNGCTDLDIYYSPFTNTLAIQRLNLEPGESIEINTAFIILPELLVISDPQRYTCMEKTFERGKYLYENLESGFRVELFVDSDKLLFEYPGFFKRQWSR